MLENIQQFIEKYYINPIIYDTGYNPINTITWFTIILISIYVVLKLFSLIDINIDDTFIIALAPYIVFGSILRLFEDSGVIQPPLEYLLLTPIVYEVALLITVFFALFAKGISPRLNMPNWQALFGSMGIILSISCLVLLFSVCDVVHPEVFLWILGFGTAIVFIIYGIGRFFNISFLSNWLNTLIIWVHLLNTLSIYIWLDSIFHNATIFHKEYKWTYFVLPLLWILDTKFKNKDFLRNILKLSLLYLGLASATRNTLRLVFGIWNGFNSK